MTKKISEYKENKMENKQAFTLSRHAEFISASSRYHNNKPLKQVQGDERNGFTLIELLVVVLIIGILAAIALPQYQLAVAKSRFTQIMILGDSLWKAQKMYYLANGQYATTIKQLDIGMPGGETGTSGSYNGGYCTLQESQLLCTGLDNKVIYVRIYNEKRRLCRNESKDAFIRKLCLSLGGTSANTSNGIEQYVLP